MFAHLPKAKLVAALALLLAAAAGVLVFMLCSQQRPKILDTRFRVTSVQAFRGTNHVVYFSNQLMGGARERLAKLGLGIKPVAHGTFTAMGTNLWVAVVYAGNLSPQELDGIEAQLVNNAGKVFKLYQAVHSREPNTKDYLGAWLVDLDSKRFRSTNNPSYKLQLGLPNGGPQLAEIPLGSL